MPFMSSDDWPTNQRSLIRAYDRVIDNLLSVARRLRKWLIAINQENVRDMNQYVYNQVSSNLSQGRLR